MEKKRQCDEECSEKVKKVKNGSKSAKTLKKWQKWLFEKKSPKKGTLRTIFLKKLRNIFLIYIKMTKKNMKTSKNEQKRATFFFVKNVIIRHLVGRTTIDTLRA